GNSHHRSHHLVPGISGIKLRMLASIPAHSPFSRPGSACRAVLSRTVTWLLNLSVSVPIGRSSVSVCFFGCLPCRFPVFSHAFQAVSQSRSHTFHAFPQTVLIFCPSGILPAVSSVFPDIFSGPVLRSVSFDSFPETAYRI